MRAYAVPALIALSFSTGFSQSSEIKDLGSDWVETGFPAHGKLHMDLQSGEVHITGSEDPKVRVRCVSQKGWEGYYPKMHLKASGRAGDLEISGGPKNNFRYEIQIPKDTDLVLRMPAGELHVEGIVGNKDLRLHAGELNLQVGDPEAYGPVSASLMAGDINAEPFGVEKGGIFRSFHREGKGRYSLQVKVKAGEINLTR